jgi:cold shock CspA family protein/ribosome-associated translation inhibitor RaiA
MQLPLEIAARCVELDHATRRRVVAAARKLEQFYDRIMTCRVSIDIPQRHRIGAPIAYRVRIDLTLPGGERVVHRKARPDLMTAVQDAFDAAQRRLHDYAQVQRGTVKQAVGAPRAVVSRLFPFEGYGFLETADGREIYFHRNSVRRADFDALAVGSAVRFVEEAGDQGPQASTVTMLRRRRKGGFGPSNPPGIKAGAPHAKPQTIVLGGRSGKKNAGENPVTPG